MAALASAVTAIAALASGSAHASEPPQCLSSDPSQWPAPSKPYFMVVFDTSGSMTDPVSGSNSCGYPNDRLGHGRCALKNTLLAYAGQADFGLATYATQMNNCSGACYSGCQYFVFPGDNPPKSGCGPESNNDPTTRQGANILVPMLQDNYWSSPPNPTNIAQLVQYVDNDCSTSKELYAAGATPINGALRDMYRYYSSSWTQPGGGITYTSPLNDTERPCRSVNVLLVTDGDETCDTQQDAVNAAAALYNGFTKGSDTWHVRTFVVNFAGGNQTATDQIAAAGGTTQSYFATDETSLSQALADIIAGSVKPETCNNVDDNCNGCTDEGFKHYCDVQQTCCAWTTAAQRQTCLQNYEASITPSNPNGNVALLPCTTVAQQTDPANWLCFNPGDICDNADNNCNGTVDENQKKCGSPLHCPTTEVCNGQDDNCDGVVDEGCPAPCIPSPEVCDGCDNDCDGIADNGVAAVACGLPSPPNCVGTMACKPAQAVPYPGACVAGGGFQACSNNPQPEVCDGLDNNCNGLIDDGIAPVACVPPGTPTNLVYGGTSQCKMGTQACGGTCVGFVGPSPEVCDGIDNDCNGIVDDNVPQVGQSCGINQPPCTPGKTACVNGVLTCQGGTGPQPEICDGIDNNCNGIVDEAPLADGPAPGANGCWTDPGNCCTFKNLSWCPPLGATCNGNGTLTAPCNKGTLVCAGKSGWICQGPKEPGPEVCDGVDNDCNGQVDDGNIPQVGQPCGSNVGVCQYGSLVCNSGMLDCVGGVQPSPEICDGLDNDCNGVIDNGIPVGGDCTPPYDTTLYPGPRNSPPCQPGKLVCDGNGGIVCVGGVGPSPEICDGKDNDCDGLVDESGTAPDGVNGTTNPSDPTQHIGDACGSSEGACKPGQIACINGGFLCSGGVGPTPEVCDCNDNNCNGKVDEQDPNAPPICSPGKQCIKSASNGCQCAAPCGGGEFPCPTGQSCEQVTSSETGAVLGSFCVAQACPGGCADQTTKDSNGTVLCAPAGTVLANCYAPPVCVCKGQTGCAEPCSGVTCTAPLVCTNYGPNAGKCVADNNCYDIPCKGCDTWCNGGTCQPNPCTPNPCTAPNDVCKPKSDPMAMPAYDCVGSCANVTCGTGQKCENGKCVATCPTDCPMGQVCDEATTPPSCVPNLCSTPCANDACCDPLTGACGNCPCAGVVCPTGQVCKNDQCVSAPTTTTTSSASTGSSGGSGAGATGAGGTGASPDTTRDSGAWGLATGGGGCACELGAGASRGTELRNTLLTLALAILVRRRRRRNDKREGGRAEEVSR